MRPTLSIIVASAGRVSLDNTLASITSQMLPGDELLVDVNDNAPWGHAARQRKMHQASGDALLFIDDDDQYLPGGLDAIRRGFATAPTRPHLFQMQYDINNFVLWQDREVREGNVSTQMICVPNRPDRLGQWGSRYEGDYDFIRSTCERMGDPVWHQDVIALICHPVLRAA